MKLNRPCAKAWTNHPQPRRPMNNTNSDYHVIEHGIAIVLALICSLINNITGTQRWLYFSTPTNATKPTADPKREAGGMNAESLCKASSTRTKTTTRGATSKTGTSSAKSPRKPRTRIPKDVNPSPSKTAQVDTASCPDQMSHQTIECPMTSTPVSKTTSQKSTRKNDLPTAKQTA